MPTPDLLRSKSVGEYFSRFTPVHAPQACPRHDSLRRLFWPVETPEARKLFGNLNDLQRTAVFVQTETEFPFERSTRRGRKRTENLLLSTTALIKSQMAAIRGRLSVIVYGQPVVLACKQIEPGYALAAEKVSVQTFSLPASSLCGFCFSFSVAVSSWLYLITKTHVTSLHINAAFCRLIRLGR